MAKKKAAKSSAAETDSQPAAKPIQAESVPPSSATSPLIVGVGASSGGLDAFSQVLRSLPPEPGLALIFVQHMAPQHESMLASLLAGASTMPVLQVSEDTEIRVNHVYVVPPNRTLRYEHGVLAVHPRPQNATQYTPINAFFESLADGLGERAVVVILSGSGGDGTEGVHAIKARGGIVLVQDPATAKFTGMPQTAIATSKVDVILTPEHIADELAYLAKQSPITALIPRKPGDSLTLEDQHLDEIFHILRIANGVDFSQYKLPTLQRRIQRRMVLQRVDSPSHYVKFLKDTPAEAAALFQDIFIHVTRFFRDPESFEFLSQKVFPALFEARRPDAPLRIWVPGCSTGEEAYSIAMKLTEYLEESKQNAAVQIFATDISDQAVEKARAAIYPASVVDEISPERIRRFFVPTDGHYRISKAIRDQCVFARQDLIRDPPFSKLDFIVCRNVLIYLGQPVQSKLISIFHYALKSNGYLMLGNAETIGAHAELFSVVDKTHRVYCKKIADRTRDVSFPVLYNPLASKIATETVSENRRPGSMQAEVNRLILDRYAPSGVVVNDDMRILHFRGQTGRYIEPAPGDASLNLLKMCREGLTHALRGAIQNAQKKQSAVRREGLRVKCDGELLEVAIEVIPMKTLESGTNYLVLFHESKDQVPDPLSERTRSLKKSARKTPGTKRTPADEVERLQSELVASRQYLQSIIQDLESTNEELQSANEEILSSNEEFQSTNEELDTAKEELQSTNEELNTVNEQLHSRNEELATINSDLVNLLNGVHIAIVIVARDLRLRRFTPIAESVLNLIPSDIGRPITQIKPNINFPELEKSILQVIDSVTVQHHEVQDSQGHWYSLTIRPYKSVDNRIDGAVITLFDTDEVRRFETQMQEAQEFAQGVLDTIQDGLVELNEEFRILRFNTAFCEFLHASESDLIGRFAWDVGRGQWSSDDLRAMLKSDQLAGDLAKGVHVKFQVRGGSYRGFQINGRVLPATERRGKRILLAMAPISSDMGGGDRNPNTEAQS